MTQMISSLLTRSSDRGLLDRVLLGRGLLAGRFPDIRRDAIRQAREQARRSLDLDRIGAGAMGFVQRMAQRAGSQLDSFATRLDERLTYKTGEVTGPGTLTCTQCSQQLSFEQATRIPPCPKCRGTNYRRGY